MQWNRFTTDSPGRLTIIDIVFFGVAIFLLALMSRPMYSVLANSSLSTGPAYMFQLIFPGAVGTVMVVIMATAVSGS